jgi:DMSO/TMAO reductase YedYZ molybdopterin-dependent catalytic subunit
MDFWLEVNGAVVQPLHLSLNDIRQDFTAYTVSTQFLNDDRTVSASYTGARLWDILQVAGIKEEASSDLKIMARSIDRFRCILRWHEVNPLMSDRLILVAYEQNGQAISAEEGPLRLVVPGDERGRRYIRRLASLTLLDQGADEA